MAQKIAVIGCMLLAVLFFTVARAQLTTDTVYQFTSAAEQQRFQQLTEQLRCLVCQNESLADSSAPLAKDLRSEVYQQVKSGKSNAEIKSYLVTRYGEFVLFKPAFNAINSLLWLVPFALLILGFLIVFRIAAKAKRKPNKYE